MVRAIMSDPKKKTVSYSQYAKWFKCPHQWELDYIKGLKTFEANLNLTYGNAIHETLQHYVKTLYTEGMLKATTLGLRDYFIDHFVQECTDNKIVFTQDEMQEFVEDGVEFIKEFMTAAVRLQHFPPDKYEFLGVEDELNMDLTNNTQYWGYIDLVLKEKATGRIKIFDFKTSRMAWTASQMEDLSKTSQLVLYKALYSRKHNVPVSQIDVEFMILKRKLYPNSKFRQTRIQVFKPESNQKEVTRVIDHFTQFITESFKPDGTYNTDIKYPKIPGKNKTNCKYCLHKGKTCNAIADIKD
jgi:hypothetical protein